MGLFKSPENDWRAPAQAQGALNKHPFAPRQLQMKGSDPFSERSDQVGHTKPMGGASLALIRRQEAEENRVCFSSGTDGGLTFCWVFGNKHGGEPGLKGQRTLAVLKLQSRNGWSTRAWSPGPNAFPNDSCLDICSPVMASSPFHPLLYWVLGLPSHSELLLLFFTTRDDNVP